MKIAFINLYQKSVNRGLETFVNELSKRLDKKFDIDIISGEKSKYKNWKKEFLWRLFLDKNSIEVFKFTLIEFKKIWFKKYDIIFPMNGGWEIVIIKLITLFQGNKMIISGQSGIGWHDRINLYSFPDYFIPLTNYAKKWADKINPFVKTKVIPNGVDITRFKIYDSGIKNKTKTVLAVGAFTKDKRHDLTIEAVSKIPNTKLIILGGGGDKKEEIKNYGIKLLDKDKFELLSVPFDKVPEVYKKANVFVYPTVPWESFGIAMVEAMASGLPVVAADDPIRREIVGSAGLFVDPTDIDAYSKAIEKALNTNWKDLPRKQAEKFSWDKIAESYENLFKELI